MFRYAQNSAIAGRASRQKLKILDDEQYTSFTNGYIDLQFPTGRTLINKNISGKNECCFGYFLQSSDVKLTAGLRNHLDEPVACKFPQSLPFLPRASSYPESPLGNA